MAERSATFLWSMRFIYLGLCGLVMFLHLLPLEPVTSFWAAPDLMVAITFAWVLRRPEYAPLFFIAGIFLLADFLFHRPPGLWAALVLIGSQTLRAKAPDLRDLTFPVEWLTVATTLVIMTLGYRLILGLTVVDQAPLGLSLIQLVMTLLACPIVVFVTQAIFGVRKLAPGDVDAIAAAAQQLLASTGRASPRDFVQRHCDFENMAKAYTDLHGSRH